MKRKSRYNMDNMDNIDILLIPSMLHVKIRRNIQSIYDY